MATLLLSTGVPMILGGDEMGRTQDGNNNAYCQDDEISWFDWNKVDGGLLDFTKDLITLRRNNPALRPDWFRQAPETGSANSVQVLRADAQNFGEGDWNEDHRAIAFVLEHEGSDAFAVLFNAAENGVEFTVPEAPRQEWELALSTDPDQQVEAPVSTLIVRDRSVTVLRSRA
ncbi:hypothetical protein [Paenarthrobacter sp. AR 02]|uniref:hypothetical protein n=1 Tax=Paenarthrobacter sp. AR 02 TaxID=2899821 RepID=UPI0035AB8169